MAFSYTGLGNDDPMQPMDLSFGQSSPMAPLSSTAPNTRSATAAAVAANPATPSGAANPMAPVASSASAPMINPVTGENMNPTFFQKGGGFSVALGALQTLGNLWNSFQQVKIAKDTLNFQKQSYATNLANTTKDYNTRLASDAKAYAAYAGRSEEDTDAYIKERSL